MKDDDLKEIAYSLNRRTEFKVLREDYVPKKKQPVNTTQPNSTTQPNNTTQPENIITQFPGIHRKPTRLR